MREEHYLEYVRVMKASGLEDEILPPHGAHEREPTRFTVGAFLHTFIFGTMVLYLITVVWHETFGHITHYYEAQHAIAEYRAAWGFFRDRRPELYGALRTADGVIEDESER